MSFLFIFLSLSDCVPTLQGIKEETTFPELLPLTLSLDKLIHNNTSGNNDEYSVIDLLNNHLIPADVIDTTGHAAIALSLIHI